MDPRWVSLSSSLFMETVAGSGYAFSVYSPSLKASLNFTQTQIQGVGSASGFGMYAAILAGFAFDAAGPVMATGVGAVLSAIGYVVLWAAATGRLHTDTPARTLGAVVAANVIWSSGSAFLDVTAIATNARNFPHDRGLVLGLCKSLFGLSASVLTLIYTCVYKPHVEPFLLFCGIFISCTAAVAAVALRVAPSELVVPLTRGERRKLSLSLASVLALALYLAGVSVCISRNVTQPHVAFVLGLIPLLGVHALLAVPSKCAAPSNTELERKWTHEEGLLINAEQWQDDDGRESRDTVGASFVEVILDVDFLIFLAILFTGTGAGVTMINNVGSLTQSLGGGNDSQDVYVVILSIFNCIGRMAFGAASDAFASRISRPAWLTLAVASMAGAMAVSSVANMNVLYLAVAWTGFSYGAFWSLGPAMVAEVFGNLAFGSVTGVSAVIVGVAGYVMSAVVAADIYESHIIGGGTVCMGTACYQLTFTILAVMNAAAAVLGIVLTCRLKQLYSTPTGRCVSFLEHRAMRPVPNYIRSLQQALLPFCRCRCGRWLLTGRTDRAELGYTSMMQQQEFEVPVTARPALVASAGSKLRVDF